MNLFTIIERGLNQRRLSSILTALSVALGVMVVCAILVARREMQNTYLRQGEGYSLIVGPSGSPLELVLNSVFHVGKSAGLIPYSVHEEFAGQKWAPSVRLSVPYAVGDSFRGYRVVATTEGIFSRHFPFPAGEGAEKLAEGVPFEVEPHCLEEALHLVSTGRGGEDPGPGASGDGHDHDHDHARSVAVIGAEVASALGLKPGDLIEPTHGIEGGPAHEHEHLWEVVGVFKRSGTPVDRVVFINLDSFYRIAEHAGGRIPETGEAAISSVLIFPRGGVAKPRLLSHLTKRGDVQVAEVAEQITFLIRLVGDVDRFFMWISVLVVVIGVVSIAVAIYNTMNERRREMAIMRAIGARRSTILATVVGEATALSLTGAVLGVVFGHTLLFAVSGYIKETAGLEVSPFDILPEELGVIAIVTLAGALAGLLPAWKAYRTDVARHLAPLS